MGTQWFLQRELLTPSRRISPNRLVSKRSKRKLTYPVPEYVHSADYTSLAGEAYVDIISRLDSLPPLDLIFTYLDGSSLEAMAKVSRTWRQIVHKNKMNMKVIKSFRCTRNLTKENIPVLRKTRSLDSSHQPPFHLSNTNFRIHPFNMDEIESPRKRINDVRVRCPRCSKSSKVFRLPIHSISGLDRTYPPFKATSSTTSWNTSLQDDDDSNDSNSFAECDNELCAYKFCMHCLCTFHPGEKCRITELGTPSKILRYSENISPKSNCSNQTSKVNRKKSLKRLCF